MYIEYYEMTWHQFFHSKFCYEFKCEYHFKVLNESHIPCDSISICIQFIFLYRLKHIVSVYVWN